MREDRFFTRWTSLPDRPPAGRVAAVAIVLALAACGGEDGGAVASTGGDAAAGLHEVRGPVDEAMAARGEKLFRDLGCTACHRLEDRLVGPPLEGVTSRRDYPWFHHMVTNPDSMIRNDSIGKALLAEYLTPMSNQGVTGEDARALFEYFRQVDGSAPGASAAGADGRESDLGDDNGS